MIIHYGNFGLSYFPFIPAIDDKHCKLIPFQRFLSYRIGIIALIMFSSLEFLFMKYIY